jgi:hypothetical protein
MNIDGSGVQRTATADSDYLLSAGSLTFAPGVTTLTVSIAITGDTTAEPDESFFINLINALGASIADSVGVVTIGNDDA